MQLTLLAQAMLSASPGSPPGPVTLASDATGFNPDQLTSSANSLADRELPKPWNSVFEGDYAIAGAGVVALPRFEGSKDIHPLPAAGAIGTVKGVGFTVKGPAVTFDFVKDGKAAKLGFHLGPTVQYNGNRTKQNPDPVIAALPKLKGVFEAGVNAGIDIKRVLNKHDSLSLGGSVRWDISGKGAGKVAAPTAGYFTPLSKGKAIGVEAGAEFADRKYANYHFGVTAAASAASGLPAYTAKGGIKAVRVAGLAAFDFNNNFLDGGFALAVGAQYTRLKGFAAKSPIVVQRGKRGQWMFGAGLTYTL